MINLFYRKWAGLPVLIFFLCNAKDLAAQMLPDSIKTNTVIISSADSVTILPDTVDKRPRNAYGDLLNDDPRYNPRSSWLIPVLKVTASNVFGWAWSRYVTKEDWAKNAS